MMLFREGLDVMISATCDSTLLIVVCNMNIQDDMHHGENPR